MLRNLPSSRWNDVTAAHLLNRAGLGAEPATITRTAKLSPEAAVESLLDFSEAEDPGAPTWLGEENVDQRPQRPALRDLPEAERQKMQQEWRQRERERITELRAWWLYRMRYTSCPLREKLTLFWHGHFATSMEKVRSAYCMYRQNETFRAHAAGNWPDLVEAVARDPAMLIYLDNAQSRAGQPNENFARELMELFTLGEGHYTEEDIKAAARAFTGWSIAPETFTFENRARAHDKGSKTLLGQTGAFDGTDAIRVILEQPAAARWITGKLWAYFAYPDPEPDLLNELAARLVHHRYAFKPWLREVFLSEAFYSARALHTQIKSPVQWLVGTARALECPLPSGERCALILRELGQELFAPPNVRGWTGGPTWITATTLFHRYNFANTFLKDGPGVPPDNREAMPPPERRARAEMARGKALVDTQRLLPDSERTSREEVQRALEWRLYQRPLRAKDRLALRESLAQWPEPAQWREDDVRTLLHTMMSTPLYQVT